MRFGGDTRGLVSVSLPLPFSNLCFPCWLLVAFGFNNILSFTHQ